MAIVENVAGGGAEEFGQQVEERRFASAIGADQGVDLAPLHLQVDVAHRDKALEFLGQALGFEYVFVHAQRRGAVTGCPPPTHLFTGDPDTAAGARQSPGSGIIAMRPGEATTGWRRQRPFHCGLRLATNASIPSWASSAIMLQAIVSLASS